MGRWPGLLGPGLLGLGLGPGSVAAAAVSPPAPAPALLPVPAVVPLPLLLLLLLLLALALPSPLYSTRRVVRRSSDFATLAAPNACAVQWVGLYARVFVGLFVCFEKWGKG